MQTANSQSERRSRDENLQQRRRSASRNTDEWSCREQCKQQQGYYFACVWPRGLFFIPHQAMLTHNFLLSLSAAISCSDHLLATAGLIRQTVGRSADVTLGAHPSHFGPGRRRVAASPSGHRLQNSGNHTLLFLLLLPVTSARNLSIRATVT